MTVTPSSPSWLAAAVADLPTLLIDHAHCEKRAASTAVRFLFKYPDWPALVDAMSKLAREELVHFDRVRKELRARAVTFRALPSASYATALFELVAADTRKVDEMLLCALIEARSHERFVLLEAAVSDAGLADFYRELGEAEARHGELYVALAEEAARGDSDFVARRLAALTSREAEIVARPCQPVRMHSGG